MSFVDFNEKSKVSKADNKQAYTKFCKIVSPKAQSDSISGSAGAVMGSGTFNRKPKSNYVVQYEKSKAEYLDRMKGSGVNKNRTYTASMGKSMRITVTENKQKMRELMLNPIQSREQYLQQKSQKFKDELFHQRYAISKYAVSQNIRYGAQNKRSPPTLLQ